MCVCGGGGGGGRGRGRGVYISVWVGEITRALNHVEVSFDKSL